MLPWMMANTVITASVTPRVPVVRAVRIGRRVKYARGGRKVAPSRTEPAATNLSSNLRFAETRRATPHTPPTVAMNTRPKCRFRSWTVKKGRLIDQAVSAAPAMVARARSGRRPRTAEVAAMIRGLPPTARRSRFGAAMHSAATIPRNTIQVQRHQLRFTAIGSGRSLIADEMVIREVRTLVRTTVNSETRMPQLMAKTTEETATWKSSAEGDIVVNETTGKGLKTLSYAP